MGCRGEDTPERLFRRHVVEMREYATEIECVIGGGPIVSRIRKCADECESALERLRKEKIERDNRAFERDPKGDAQTPSPAAQEPSRGNNRDGQIR